MSKELFTDPRWTEIPAFEVVGKGPEPSKEERAAAKRKLYSYLRKIGVLNEEEYGEKIEELNKVNEQ